jgi:hypothetical protein
MGRILTEQTSRSPRLTGPSEENLVPDRLRVDGQIPTWDQATRRFRLFVDYLEKEDVDTYRALDFETFTSGWASAAWSELYRIDQKACRWAEATALIIFSGSYWLDKESETFIPPVTYLTQLQSSKQARQKALSRVLKDVNRWQSVRVIGGTGYNGYPRVYLGLYLSDAVPKDTFDQVLSSHVDNCPIAEENAHRIHDIVNISDTPEHKSRLIHGLGQNVPALNSRNAISSENWEKQKIATILHGGGWRSYSFGISI